MTMVDDRTVIRQLDEPAEAEAPRFFDFLDLVALSTAVSCACVFIAATMRHWNAGFIEHQAVTLTHELTAQAVRATGYTEPDWYRQERLSFITVRVFGFKERIGIEVWDRSTDLLPPAMPIVGYETPSGLQVVDQIASKWGSSPVPSGRVMWAELPVYEVTAAGLPLRARKPSPYLRTSTASPVHEPATSDLLGRLLDGLKRL